MHNYINLNRLVTFYHVARAGSFAVASQQLDVAQPALSRTIKLLEEDIGSQLFHRLGPKGLALTVYGETLFKRMTRIYADVHEALNSLPPKSDNLTRDYAPYLKEWKDMVKLDFEYVLKARGVDAAMELLDSAYEHTVLHLEQIRDEIGGRK